MITYCSIRDIKSMKLHSIGIEIFTIEYCLRQPNYALVSATLTVEFSRVQRSQGHTEFTLWSWGHA